MPLFDEKNQKLLLGFMVGAAAGALATKLGPQIAEAAKPALKSAMKLAILGAEASREFVAHAKEALEDATAEAAADLKTEPASTTVEKVTTITNDFVAAMSGRKGVGSA